MYDFHRVSRGDPIDPGQLIRLALEPMADDFGVAYNKFMFERPHSNETLVMGGLQCGASLVMAFAYPDGWTDAVSDGTISPRVGRRLAKYVQASLQTDDGREGIASAVQGYASAIARFWRRAAAKAEQQEETSRLLDNAERSEALGALITKAFPVKDFHGVLANIASAEAHRFYDPANPDALIDLQAYAERARVTSDALALVAGEGFPKFEAAIIAPVMNFRGTYAAERQADWLSAGRHWTNLLSPEPLSYSEMNDAIDAERQASSSADK